VKTVAFIGLGRMGQPMAANLAREGFQVRSFDTNGFGSCGSIREAAQGAEVLVTMLPDGKAVRQAALGASHSSMRRCRARSPRRKTARSRSWRAATKSY
jgi:3-hydroxyisobutyrate dehydrogenase-like beta-hydroxyacid dehydrogenase